VPAFADSLQKNPKLLVVKGKKSARMRTGEKACRTLAALRQRQRRDLAALKCLKKGPGFAPANEQNAQERKL
jgi:hypothetical protein